MDSTKTSSKTKVEGAQRELISYDDFFAFDKEHKNNPKAEIHNVEVPMLPVIANQIQIFIHDPMEDQYWS